MIHDDNPWPTIVGATALLFIVGTFVYLSYQGPYGQCERSPEAAYMGLPEQYRALLRAPYQGSLISYGEGTIGAAELDRRMVALMRTNYNVRSAVCQRLAEMRV